MMPVNFSRTDFGPTHIISAEADRAITLVTYQSKMQQLKTKSIMKSVLDDTWA